MDGITKGSIKTAKLMKQLWPQLTDKEAIDEVKHYVHSDLIMLKVVNIVLLDS